MELSQQDILRLYGNRVHLIPSDQERIIRYFTSGGAVGWKMKPDAKLALILTESEFKEKALTTKLKECLVNAEIDTSWVGFGMIKNNGPWNMSSMPVGHGIVFGNQGIIGGSLHISDEQIIYPCPLLADIFLEKTDTDKLSALFTKIKTQLA